MTEYEVLRRHDVYVVRKVGTQKYLCQEAYIDGSPRWEVSLSGKPYLWGYRWVAIFAAILLERQDKRRAKRAYRQGLIDKATEERVWR